VTKPPQFGRAHKSEGNNIPLSEADVLSARVSAIRAGETPQRTGNSSAGYAFKPLISEGVTLWADMFIPSLAGFVLLHGCDASCELHCCLFCSERSAEQQG